MRAKIKAWIVVASLVVAIGAEAQTPPARLIPFQARLTNVSDQPVDDGVYTLTFNIYDQAEAGETCWTEVHQNVSVINGQINVILGAITSLDDPNPLVANDAINFNPIAGTSCIPTAMGSCQCQGRGQRYLGITVGNNPLEMVPRHQLVPSFHARRADTADVALLAEGIKDGIVTSSKLADNAITASKISNAAVTTAKLDPAFVLPVTAIANDSLSSAKIIDGSITGADILDGSIALADLNQNALPAIGSLELSLLDEAQFQSQRGIGWILADGRNVTGSAYHTLTGQLSVPDARGVFLRGKNNGRSDGNQNPDGELALGTYTADKFTSHTHFTVSVESTSGAQSLDGTSGIRQSFSGGGSADYLLRGESVNTVPMRGRTSPTSVGAGNEVAPKAIMVNIFIRIN